MCVTDTCRKELQPLMHCNVLVMDNVQLCFSVMEMIKGLPMGVKSEDATESGTVWFELADERSIEGNGDPTASHRCTPRRW